MDVDKMQEENDLRELLELLLMDGFFDNDTEIGIVKKIIADGKNGLVGKQVDVYRDFIEPKLEDTERVCKRCQVSLADLPNNEKYTLISTGYCPSCENRMAKDEKKE